MIEERRGELLLREVEKRIAQAQGEGGEAAVHLRQGRGHERHPQHGRQGQEEAAHGRAARAPVLSMAYEWRPSHDRAGPSSVLERGLCAA